MRVIGIKIPNHHHKLVVYFFVKSAVHANGTCPYVSKRWVLQRNRSMEEISCKCTKFCCFRGVLYTIQLLWCFHLIKQQDIHLPWIKTLKLLWADAFICLNLPWTCTLRHSNPTPSPTPLKKIQCWKKRLACPINERMRWQFAAPGYLLACHLHWHMKDSHTIRTPSVLDYTAHVGNLSPMKIIQVDSLLSWPLKCAFFIFFWFGMKIIHGPWITKIH